MNTLEEKIQKDLESAILSHQEHAVIALRSVKAAIQKETTKKQEEGKPDVKRVLDDPDIIKLIQTQVKQRKESIAMYEQAGRSDLADNEKQEMDVLMNYLPKMLSESEVEAIVTKTIADLGATTMKDMGKVMGFINKTYAGQVDGAMVSRIVKSKLS